MKKLRAICLSLAICIISGLVPQAVFAGYDDVYEYDSYYTAVNRLQDLGIVSGYEDGLFHGDRAITRAEFAKLIVCAMDAETEARTYGVASRYYDVPQGSWAVPYIAYVASKGIVSGYPDGSFGPGNTITYAEALTIIGKILGYTEETIGAYWPANYIEMAANVGLTSGLNFYPNQELNRAVAAIIVDRALFTEMNKTEEATGKKPILLQGLGYTVVEDALVLAVGGEDESLFDNEIKLNNNQVYSSTIQSPVSAGDQLKYAVVNKDGDMVCVKWYDEENAPKNKYTVLDDCYIIASASDDRTLSANQIRTSKGVFTVNDTDILTKTGEVGRLVLDKDKKVLSASTHEAPYKEYVVSDVDSSSIKFISDNVVNTLNLAEDFPIYVDYGAKETFQKAQKKFTSGSELTLYSRDGSTWECGVLDTNSGYSVKNDCFIIASKTEDETLAANQVRTSDGTYSVSDTDMLSLVGKLGTVVINKDQKIEQFAPTDMVSESVVVNKVTGNNVDYTGADGAKGSYKFDNTFVTYLDYMKSTYALSAGSIEIGTELTFYGDNRGSWRFAVIDSTDDITPILASHDYDGSETSLESMTIDKDGLTVYRGGKAATLADIRKNDVVYYNKKINTMDVYDKKVTGIYYDAQPSKAYVTDVTVGGKNYHIGETTATNKLDASAGSFEIGDKVTLLLGKNDEVVFAVELTDFDYFNYGVVESAGKKLAESGANEGSSETYVRMFMPDGETYEYTADKDYEDYKGKLVSISYNSGKVSLKLVGTTSRTYGDVNYSDRTIGGKTALRDIKIIQRLSDESDSDVRLETLSFETLEVSTLSEANVIASVAANKFGDIGILYVTGLAGSVSYGVLQSVSYPETETPVTHVKIETNEPCVYNVFGNSQLNKFTSVTRYSAAAESAVSYRVSGGQITSMSAMYKLKSSSGIDAVEGSRIMIGGTIYKMYSGVEIVDISNRDDYKTVSVDDLAAMKNITNVTIYSDKSLADGGVVRVVTIKRK